MSPGKGYREMKHIALSAGAVDVSSIMRIRSEGSRWAKINRSDPLRGARLTKNHSIALHLVFILSIEVYLVGRAGLKKNKEKIIEIIFIVLPRVT
jgi:hypothetical protein